MGAGGSTKLPYTSVEDAKKAGKTQAEIDAWLATNQPAASASAASAATSATATQRPILMGSASSGPKQPKEHDQVCEHRHAQASEAKVSYAHTQKRTAHIKRAACLHDVRCRSQIKSVRHR